VAIGHNPACPSCSAFSPRDSPLSPLSGRSSSHGRHQGYTSSVAQPLSGSRCSSPCLLRSFLNVYFFAQGVLFPFPTLFFRRFASFSWPLPPRKANPLKLSMPLPFPSLAIFSYSVPLFDYAYLVPIGLRPLDVVLRAVSPPFPPFKARTGSTCPFFRSEDSLSPFLLFRR